MILKTIDNAETIYSYIAGIIDGEGSITITRKSSGCYSLVVTVANNNMNLHNFLKACFNGTISSSNRNARTCQWRLVANQAKNFLVLIAPYLLLKQEQAYLGIEFQIAMSKDDKRYKKKEEKNIVNEYRETARQRMHELNSINCINNRFIS